MSSLKPDPRQALNPKQEFDLDTTVPLHKIPRYPAGPADRPPKEDIETLPTLELTETLARILDTQEAIATQALGMQPTDQESVGDRIANGMATNACMTPAERAAAEEERKAGSRRFFSRFRRET
ncbi:hypothetical protein KA119_02300 [Candidatus Gracilibacteria bacterium]|nr:hypothetical protein [Candidatus Gracilibacteria bacterium]